MSPKKSNKQPETASTSSIETSSASSSKQASASAPADEEKECCSVCTETYNKSTRKKVTCAKCHVDYCVSCIKAYLMSSTTLPHCMSCRIAWNDERLRDMVSNAWIKNEYSTKRKELLFEIEKAMLPGTMPLVERRKIEERDKQEFANVKPVLNHISFLTKELQRIRGARQEPIGHTKVAIEELKDTIRRLKFFEDKTPAELGATGTTSKSSDTDPAEARKFIKPCPEEKCNGFLSTQYKCGLCDCKTCPKCFEIIENGTHMRKPSLTPKTGEEKEAEHVCKPDNLASAAAIRAETKNCPSCGTNIFKQSGCDMMFCTKCHTAFSWRTGQLAKGPIHNPHFFEWLEKTGQGNARNPNRQAGNANACIWVENNINYIVLRNRLAKIDINLRTKIINVLQGVAHIVDNDSRRLMMPHTPEEVNEDVRVKYLMNEIDLDKLKSLCLKRNLQLDFDNARRLLYEMLENTCRDIINTIGGNIETDYAKDILNQLTSLVAYYNQHILALYNKFKRSGQFSHFNLETLRRDLVGDRQELNPKRVRAVPSGVKRPGRKQEIKAPVEDKTKEDKTKEDKKDNRENADSDDDEKEEYNSDYDSDNDN